MTDLQQLFDTDPIHLTKENIDEIISYYRTASANFHAGEKSAGSAKKAAKVPVEKVKIDLASLGLLKK